MGFHAEGGCSFPDRNVYPAGTVAHRPVGGGKVLFTARDFKGPRVVAEVVPDSSSDTRTPVGAESGTSARVVAAQTRDERHESDLFNVFDGFPAVYESYRDSGNKVVRFDNESLFDCATIFFFRSNPFVG
jgi:hypothetical protein